MILFSLVLMMAAVQPMLLQLGVVCLFLNVLLGMPLKQTPCVTESGKPCGESEVVSLPGHWPSSYCKISNVIFSSGKQIFSLNGKLQDLEKCFKVQDIWKFNELPKHQELNDIVCDQVFSQGHFFTTYYYHGSNYFHLHYDTLIPVFAALHQQVQKYHQSNKEIVVFPAVEKERGQGINWNTDAFMDAESYWMQMLNVISKSHRFLPLDRKLSGMNKTICFKEAYFGTPKINYSDPQLLQSYSDFVKKSLRIKTVAPDKTKKPSIGLIHREGRRRILNEDQLIKAMEPFASVDSVDFSGLSVRTQIQMVQGYDVLIGMNGAGLINALYLPETSVAVQLVPFKAQLNVEEFSNLLKARGLYLEWHNKRPELNHVDPGDPFGNGSDTVVDVSEFVDIVNKALKLQKQNFQS